MYEMYFFFWNDRESAGSASCNRKIGCCGVRGPAAVVRDHSGVTWWQSGRKRGDHAGESGTPISSMVAQWPRHNNVGRSFPYMAKAQKFKVQPRFTVRSSISGMALRPSGLCHSRRTKRAPLPADTDLTKIDRESHVHDSLFFFYSLFPRSLSSPSLPPASTILVHATRTQSRPAPHVSLDVPPSPSLCPSSSCRTAYQSARHPLHIKAPPS